MTDVAIIPDDIDDWADEHFDAAEDALVGHMADLNALEGHQRQNALLEWVRGPLYHGALMICDGWQGAMAREAWRLFSAELKADTPGRRWHRSSYSQGRASIKRLLCPIDAPAATYACLPFRTYWAQEDEPLIAAAVGIEPLITREERPLWYHTDITDVILWDPKRNIAQLAGEAPGQKALVLPYIMTPDEPVQVYDNPAHFLRAWASRRLEAWALWEEKRAGRWLHPISEPADGGLPGILAIGGFKGQPWASCGAARLIPPAGSDPGALHRAIVASANLPRIEEASVGRG